MGQKLKKKKEDHPEEDKKKKKKKKEEASGGKKKKAQEKLRNKDKEDAQRKEEERRRAEAQRKEEERRRADAQRSAGGRRKEDSLEKEGAGKSAKMPGRSKPAGEGSVPGGEKTDSGKRKDRTRQLQLLAALSDAVRLDILEILLDGELNASQILAQVPVVQSTLSHHMKVLCESGLVLARRDGRKTIYTRDEAVMAELIRWLDGQG